MSRERLIWCALQGPTCKRVEWARFGQKKYCENCTQGERRKMATQQRRREHKVVPTTTLLRSKHYLGEAYGRLRHRTRTA